MTILLFTGHNVPTKRYNNLLKALEHRNIRFVTEDQKDPELKEEEKHPIIVAHSLGIIRALLYCATCNIVPEKIIALDSTYLNRDFLKAHISSDKYVNTVIQQYLESKINPDKYVIHMFRYLRNISEKHLVHERPAILRLNMLAMGDHNYTSIFYYSDSVGHYPFDSKHLLTLITNKIM